MIRDYIDVSTYDAITKKYNFNDICEIRLRINQPIMIVTKNNKHILTDSNNIPIISTRFLIDSFIRKISDNSIYAVNDQIVSGYITLPMGVRVGLSGTVVYNNDRVTTIKDYTSVNIRIPHRVDNCSLTALDFILEPTLTNTLIISPPGAGKTTYLRDIIYQLSKRDTKYNTLVIDERNEICATNNGIPLLDVGGYCDIYTNCSKDYALNNGIRSMSPELIITDEIDVSKDISGLYNAANSGINIIATIHAKSIQELKNKHDFDILVKQKIFKRYIVLSKDNGPGTLDYIYDENFNLLYCRCV